MDLQHEHPYFSQLRPAQSSSATLDHQVPRTSSVTSDISETMHVTTNSGKSKRKAPPQDPSMPLPTLPMELKCMIVKYACDDAGNLSFAYSNRFKKSYNSLHPQRVRHTKGRSSRILPVLLLESRDFRAAVLKSGYLSNIDFDDTTAAAHRLNLLAELIKHPSPLDRTGNCTYGAMIDHIKEITITKRYVWASGGSFFQALAKLPKHIKININPSARTGSQHQQFASPYPYQMAEQVGKLLPYGIVSDEAMSIEVEKLLERIRFDKDDIVALFRTRYTFEQLMESIWDKVRRMSRRGR